MTVKRSGGQSIFKERPAAHVKKIHASDEIQGVSSALRPGLDWLSFGGSTMLHLPSCPAASAQFPSAQAELGRQWKNQNPSQPNPGLWADETPCSPVHRCTLYLTYRAVYTNRGITLKICETMIYRESRSDSLVYLVVASDASLLS